MAAPFADTGILLCGACGAGTVDGSSACVRCGWPLSPARGADDGGLLLSGVRRAGAGVVLARVAIDLSLLAIVIAVAWVTGRDAPGLWLVLALVLLAGLRWAGGTGRTPGALALGLRTVDASDATPPGILRTVVPVRTITADVRHGRDPLSAPPEPAQWTGGDGSAPVRVRPRPESRRSPGEDAEPRHPALTLVLDSGQRISLPAEGVIGRNPADLPADVRAIAWPDLSRTLSKSHARLEWDGRTLWVTDLGSTNGSTFRVGDAARPLVPFVRTDVPLDAVVSMGDRSLTVAAPVGAADRR